MNNRTRLAGIILFLFVLAPAIGTGCSSPLIKLTSIPKEQIPKAVLDLTDGFTPAGKSPDSLGLVWRACARKNGRQLVACTFNSMGNKDAPTLFVASFPADEHGKVSVLDGHSVMLEFIEKRRFQGSFGHGETRAVDGNRIMALNAGGLCLDPKVAKVVGTTSSGKSAETTPADGFWFLFVDGVGPMEAWSKVVGLDGAGKAIVDFSPGMLPGSDKIIR